MDWNNKDEVLRVLKHDGSDLMYVSDTLRDDEEVVLCACEHSMWAYKYASFRLQDDKDFVFKICSINGRNYKYVSERLKEDRDLVLFAVKKYGHVLKYVPYNLCKDKEICLEACKFSYKILNFVHEDLKKDFDFLVKYINDYNGQAYLFDKRNELNNDDTFLKQCISFKDAIEFISNIDFSVNEIDTMEKLYKITLDYLETTNFSLDYRIDVLRNMDLKELARFLKERFENQDYDLEPLDNSKKLEK